MKKISLYAMSLFYIAAGINHFINTSFYVAIIPFYLPFHTELVYISGLCEIVLGILLIPQFTRRASAWLIIILLIAIFPANVEMMLDYYHIDDPLYWLTVLRLPLQLVLIWWAWIFTKKTSTTV
ncbi:MAG: DoxX family membrane protein [Ignavibacteria bacterium]